MGNLKKLISIVFPAWALSLPFRILAAEGTSPLDKLKKLAPMAGYDEAMEPGEIAGQVIGALIGVLGVIFISLIVYAGYDYMVARGEEEKVSKALGTIRRSIIGLIIVIGAFAIWRFIFGQLTN